MAFNAAKIAQAMNAKMDDAIDTRGPLCPAGEFVAKVMPVRLPENDDDTSSHFRAIQWIGKEGSQHEGEEQTAVIWSVMFEVRDKAVKAATGRDTILVPYKIFLNQDAEGGADFSDRKVGSLLNALGCNAKGNAILQIQGKQAIVTVEHTPRKNDPNIVDAEVARVTKLDR